MADVCKLTLRPLKSCSGGMKLEGQLQAGIGGEVGAWASSPAGQ